MPRRKKRKGKEVDSLENGVKTPLKVKGHPPGKTNEEIKTKARERARRIRASMTPQELTEFRKKQLESIKVRRSKMSSEELEELRRKWREKARKKRDKILSEGREKIELEKRRVIAKEKKARLKLENPEVDIARRKLACFKEFARKANMTKEERKELNSRQYISKKEKAGLMSQEEYEAYHLKQKKAYHSYYHRLSGDRRKRHLENNRRADRRYRLKKKLEKMGASKEEIEAELKKLSFEQSSDKQTSQVQPETESPQNSVEISLPTVDISNLYLDSSQDNLQTTETILSLPVIFDTQLGTSSEGSLLSSSITPEGMVDVEIHFLPIDTSFNPIEIDESSAIIIDLPSDIMFTTENVIFEENQETVAFLEPPPVAEPVGPHLVAVTPSPPEASTSPSPEASTALSIEAVTSTPYPVALILSPPVLDSSSPETITSSPDLVAVPATPPPSIPCQSQCPNCPLTFTHTRKLHSHIRSSHTWKCPKCSEVMSCSKSLSEHYKTFHTKLELSSTASNPDSHSSFYCMKCGNSFQTRDNLFLHVKQKHSSFFFPCSNCHILKYSLEQLQIHEKICHSKNPLPPKDAPANDELPVKKKKDPTEFITFLGGTPPMYQCKTCEKKFKTKANIKYHEFCGEEDKPFKCETCGQGFISKHHYKYHLRTHTGERPYACTLCGKSFNQRAKVTRHMSTHLLEKPFTCRECNRGFSTSEQLQIHISSHTGEPPFACPLCNKRFSGLTILNNHVITHTGDRPFPCPHCEKTFALKWALDTHLKTHSGARPYLCDQCSKAFPSSKDLRRHQLVHSGEKPYKCPMCESTHCRKDNLERHLTKTHNQPKDVAKQLVNEAVEEYLSSQP